MHKPDTHASKLDPRAHTSLKFSQIFPITRVAAFDKFEALGWQSGCIAVTLGSAILFVNNLAAARN